jgi:hypothetical protein
MPSPSRTVAERLHGLLAEILGDDRAGGAGGVGLVLATDDEQRTVVDADALREDSLVCRSGGLR